MSTNIAFLSSARYSQPLDATTEKKFRSLKCLGRLFVVGFSNDLRPQRFTEHVHFYLLPKLPLPFLRYAEMFMIGPLLLLWLILRHGVQVLVAQSPYEGFATALAKKIGGWFGYKVVLIVESHGDFEESLFLQRRVPFERLYRFVMHYAARFSLMHADLLRAISNSTKEQLERQSPGKPIVRFPAWTDMEVFLQAGGSREQNFPQSILFAGVLTPLKGVHHLINAFVCVAKEFPQAQLVLAGHEGNKSYTAELKEQVKRCGLVGRVQFMGAMPQTNLAGWMRQACVFVLPSVSEGLGRVVVEAMATGTPVIGSNVGGIPEIVEDGSTGFLVPPGDEKALAEKVRWILDNPEEAREMGNRARLFAAHLFSTETYVKGYEQIFEAAQPSIEQEEQKHAASSL